MALKLLRQAFFGLLATMSISSIEIFLINLSSNLKISAILFAKSNLLTQVESTTWKSPDTSFLIARKIDWIKLSTNVTLLKTSHVASICFWFFKLFTT